MIRNSELISGNLGKKTLGETKDGLFARLARDVGVGVSALAMGRVAKIAGRYLSHVGFSMGIADVWPNKIIETEKKKIMDLKFGQLEKNITAYNNGTLQCKVGMDAA